MQPKPSWKLLPGQSGGKEQQIQQTDVTLVQESEHLNQVTFKHSFLWHPFTETPKEPLTKDNLSIQPLQLQASIAFFKITDHQLSCEIPWTEAIPLFLQSPLNSVSVYSQRRLFKGIGGKRLVLPRWTERGCEEAEVIPMVWPSNSFLLEVIILRKKSSISIQCTCKINIEALSMTHQTNQSKARGSITKYSEITFQKLFKWMENIQKCN